MSKSKIKITIESENLNGYVILPESEALKYAKQLMLNQKIKNKGVLIIKFDKI